MREKEQVCSLELAKKLKELGVEQNSYWYWGKLNGGSYFLTHDSNTNHYGEIKTLYSAFTVAELGELLPGYDYYYPYSFKGTRAEDKYSCVYIFAQDNTVKKQFYAKTEADCRAKMLIYLLENNLINKKESNTSDITGFLCTEDESCIKV